MSLPIQLHIKKDDLLAQIELLTTNEDYLTVLDSCNMPSACNLKQYELMAAWGAKSVFTPLTKDIFGEFKKWRSLHSDWAFGLFSYDLKNNIEKLSSKGPSYTNCPPIAFFIPQHVITIDTNGDCLLFSDVLNSEDFEKKAYPEPPSKLFDNYVKIESRTSKENYISDIIKIKEMIAEGEVYELNYCQEFYCQPAQLINPYGLYKSLIKKNPSPFSAFFKFESHYMLSSSPERFLLHQDSILTSQPIKGTAKRQKSDREELAKTKLFNSEKDRAENVMIVDLVRNDLSRSCLPGTVKLKELFGIYTYPFVYQMISTIEGQMHPANDALDALKNCFPMGSMTGAPKIAAMKIIDQIEKSSRGWYSGAMGYIDPKGNFDFNVAIRSYFYNQKTDYLSVWAGGAITYDSDAESEYKESLLKAKVLIEQIRKAE
jgi:para-aminobenzoate synthetase component 1